MNEKIKIIPVFVPHVGCQNECVFCNQRKITGVTSSGINKDYAVEIIEKCSKTIDKAVQAELAFFGGSFTAINDKLLLELLEVGKYYKDKGIVKRIRCSTRPDAIDSSKLDLLKSYGIDIIELGIQSLDDEVLEISGRGHTKKDSENASKMIRKYKFILGHQIMPGLPGSTKEKDIKTCIESINLKPDIVRIYPTLTIKGTKLCEMYEKGIYKPLSLNDAVDLCAYIYSMYKINNIEVIRIGLQNTETIDSNSDVVSGPFHPAFRQLVEEKIYLKSLMKIIDDTNLNDRQLTISADKRLAGTIWGQKKENIKKLKDIYGISKISFVSSNDKNSIILYDKNGKIGSFYKADIFANYLN